MSKKVKKEDESWVEEAVFTSFADKGLNEVCKSLKHEPPKIWNSEEVLMSSTDLLDEPPIEVRPQLLRLESRSQRSSLMINEDMGKLIIKEIIYKKH